MKNRDLHKILKAADDRTLNSLSHSVPLSEEDKERIFSESMRKLKEKQMGGTQRIILSRTSDKRKEYEQISQLKTGISKTVISAAAALMLVIGLSGVFLMQNNKLDSIKPNDTLSSASSTPLSAYSSSDEQGSYATSVGTDVTTVLTNAPDESVPEAPTISPSSPDSEETSATTAAPVTSPTASETSVTTVTSASDENGNTLIYGNDYGTITNALMVRLNALLLFTQGCSIECDESVIWHMTDEGFVPADMTMEDARTYQNYDVDPCYLRITDQQIRNSDDARALFSDSFTEEVLSTQLSSTGNYPLFYYNGDNCYFSLSHYINRNSPYDISYATDIDDITETSFNFKVILALSNGSESTWQIYAELDNGAWKITRWTILS